MAREKGFLVIAIINAVALLQLSCGHLHMVGGSVWSVPPNKDFYVNWSMNLHFEVGDALVFVFDGAFHNVMQVSKREYDSCTAENPFQAFSVGPTTVPLIRQGIYYFICSTVNYCSLGQKFFVAVHRCDTNSTAPVSPSQPPLLFESQSPSPPLEPASPSPGPDTSQNPIQICHMAPSPDQSRPMQVTSDTVTYKAPSSSSTVVGAYKHGFTFWTIFFVWLMQGF